MIDIVKPTLLLDEGKVRRNIDRMVSKAEKAGVQLRPHFKTHQSQEIGRWFRERGINQITVSSLDMASYFAADGWDDILVDFPVNLRQMDTINALAAQITLGLLVESVETAVALNNQLTHPVQVWLKIDVGYGRTGIPYNDAETLGKLARAIAAAPKLELIGILTHSGHTYSAASPHKIVTLYHESVVRLNTARYRLQDEGHHVLVSIGDTPGCSLTGSFGQVDEIRPGNFVFYDLMQHQLGACAADDIAVAVACPIVAKHEMDQRVIIYGGAVHLSKDMVMLDGQVCYGLIALPDGDGWGVLRYDAMLVSLSQEHGLLRVHPILFDQLQVGDVLMVLPVHSCLTADLYGRYHTLTGQEISKMRTNS
jgi:D-serine deaminase-like pyridoxal phosphate-dependent protein